MANMELVVEEMKGLGEQESRTERLSRKLRTDPFFGHGLFGLAAVVAVGAYGFRRRSTPTGIYLMQLRVLAQGALAAGLASGVGVSLLSRFRPRLAVQPKVVWW